MGMAVREELSRPEDTDLEEDCAEETEDQTKVEATDLPEETKAEAEEARVAESRIGCRGMFCSCSTRSLDHQRWESNPIRSGSTKDLVLRYNRCSK